MDNGETITIHSKSDALVEVKQGDKTIIVNNQGRPTLFESIITMIFTDAEMQNKVKE